MVTVVIIGILGAVAVPAYQDYTIRSQVTEGLSLASGAKTQVAEYYSNYGEFPHTSEELGYNEATGSLISTTEIQEAVEIRTIFGEGANISDTYYTPPGVVSYETQTVSATCQANYSGTAIQERKVTTYYGVPEPSIEGWVEKSKNCTENPYTIVTNWRVQSCGTTKLYD